MHPTLQKLLDYFAYWNLSIVSQRFWKISEKTIYKKKPLITLLTPPNGKLETMQATYY